LFDFSYQNFAQHIFFLKLLKEQDEMTKNSY
jgi:hypothetical protein